MDQTMVENITDQLLKRSEDAIWQLERWIQKQEDQVNKYNNITDDSMRCAKEKQQQYYDQLKSLRRRSLYLKHCIHAGPRNSIISNKNNNIQYPQQQMKRYPLEDKDSFNKKSKQNHNNNRNSVHSLNSMQDDISYMENLVFEFKDLTLKLNELAQARKNDITSHSYKRSSSRSPSDSSSDSSNYNDSLELKPLRILSRRNIQLKPSLPNKTTNNIPTVAPSLLPVPFPPADVLIGSTPKKLQLIASSLPNSPIHLNMDRGQPLLKTESPEKRLRSVESHHSISNNTISGSNMDRKEQVDGFFKKNNRLSLAVFENMKIIQETKNNQNQTHNIIYSDDELDYINDNEYFEGANRDHEDELDQDTLLLPYDMVSNRCPKTPIFNSRFDKVPPLQRSNSHDSIFSKKTTKKPFIFYHFYADKTSSFITNGNKSITESIKTTLNDTVVVTQPTFIKPSSNSNETSSKTLLSNIINSERSRSLTPTNSNSMFSNWNLFGKKFQSNIVSETGVCNPRKGTSRIKTCIRRPSNASSVVVSSVVKHDKVKIKKLSPSKKPILDTDIKQKDLQDALNTEILL
ncbi:Vac17p PWA37_002837 [Arxiozyma heterogenica]|uniref:Vac17p n=1 Tax=Arxiozyma heterogenica TaxID=278026 RepID=UPI002EFA1610